MMRISWALYLALSQQPTILVTNTTTEMARIAELGDACGNKLVTRDAPVHLKPGESRSFLAKRRTIHTYMVCGGGLCSSSAIGMEYAGEYKFNIISDDGIIGVDVVPDDWKRSFKGCPDGVEL